MFDFKNVVGMMMQSGISRSGMVRMKHAMGDQDYLRRLAKGLQLEPEAVTRIHQMLGVSQP